MAHNHIQYIVLQITFSSSITVKLAMKHKFVLFRIYTWYVRMPHHIHRGNRFLSEKPVKIILLLQRQSINKVTVAIKKVVIWCDIWIIFLNPPMTHRQVSYNKPQNGGVRKTRKQRSRSQLCRVSNIVFLASSGARVLTEYLLYINSYYSYRVDSFPQQTWPYDADTPNHSHTLPYQSKGRVTWKVTMEVKGNTLTLTLTRIRVNSHCGWRVSANILYTSKSYKTNALAQWKPYLHNETGQTDSQYDFTISVRGDWKNSLAPKPIALFSVLFQISGRCKYEKMNTMWNLSDIDI